MNPGTLLVAGLLFGLAHAAHCAAMCGVFALAARRPGSFVLYALGKTCTYAVLGALAGVLGASVHAVAHTALAGLALLAGLVLVLGGHRLGFGWPQGWVLASATATATTSATATATGGGAGPAWLGRWTEVVWRLPSAAIAGLGDLRQRRLPGGRLLLGAVTGALPCGAVALALVQATLAGDAPRGMLFMAAFGLGTLPALAAVALLAGPLGARLPAAWLRRAGGLLVMLAGVLTALRALLPPGSCCA